GSRSAPATVPCRLSYAISWPNDDGSKMRNGMQTVVRISIPAPSELSPRGPQRYTLRCTNEDADLKQVKPRSPSATKRRGLRMAPLYACACGVAARRGRVSCVLESRGE